MKKYTVYFETGGKKLKKTLTANSHSEAIDSIIRDTIKFHKVEEEKEKSKGINELIDELQDFVNSL